MSTITIEPIAGALGANVHGVDLGKPIEDAVFDEFLQAFHTYQVLFLPEQSLNPTSQFALAARFGLPNVYAFAEGLPERPEVVEIIKEPSEAKNFGGVWHSDQPYLERPPCVTILHAKDVPRHGGDTLLASMTLAYEALSPGLKRAIRSLRAINSADIGGRGRARRGGYK
ncbi:MAG: TauD/TfdA family dioxygenase, partial [Pseudomonadota bacterium]